MSFQFIQYELKVIDGGGFVTSVAQYHIIDDDDCNDNCDCDDDEK